jgi:hypothetical protein
MESLRAPRQLGKDRIIEEKEKHHKSFFTHDLSEGNQRILPIASASLADHFGR